MKQNRIATPQTSARRQTKASTNRADGSDHPLMQLAAEAGRELQADRATRGAELSVTRSIPLALIDPPTANPRETFPEDEIRSLADSIAAVGLLHPVIVRPSSTDAGRYELVAGECRQRAVALLGDTSIECSVRDLSDVECAEIRLLENVDRKSLNAAEESQALRILEQLGHTTETLAALLRIGEDAVAARLKLADLPPFFQKWLRAERDPRRGLAAERLVPWLEFPAVLQAMEGVAERWPLTLSAFQRELTDVVLRLSRDADPSSAVGPCFRVDKKLAERLDIREIRLGGKVARRIMNTTLFDELQDRGVSAPGKKRRPLLGTPATNGNGHAAGGMVVVATSTTTSIGGADATEGVDSPATPSAHHSGEDGASALAIVDQGPDESDFDERLARWTDGWYRELLHRRITAMTLDELHGLIAHCGIDLAAEWRTTRWFLDLHSGRQLLELADAWGVDVSDCRDRGEIVAGLLATKSRHSLPPAVANVAELVDAAAVSV